MHLLSIAQNLVLRAVNIHYLASFLSKNSLYRFAECHWLRVSGKLAIKALATAELIWCAQSARGHLLPSLLTWLLKGPGPCDMSFSKPLPYNVTAGFPQHK